MKNIIKKILREQFQSPDYLKKVPSRLEPPYFYNMKEQYGITERKDQLEVMKYIYGDGITMGLYRTLWDSEGNNIYSENVIGDWIKKEYDSNGYDTGFNHSSGYWEKREYDSDGNCMYYEDSNGLIEDNR